MGILGNVLKDSGGFGNRTVQYKNLTKKIYEVPTRVQEILPICRIREDGIFQLEEGGESEDKLFDRAYLFLDANFSTMSVSERRSLYEKYCEVLNSLMVSFKIIIQNLARDMAKVQEEVFLKREDGEFSELIREFNDHIANAVEEQNAGIEQLRIFILTCRVKNAEEAGRYFESIEANLRLNFTGMQSRLIPLDTEERLRLLYDFYHMDENLRFSFDYKNAFRRSADWKDMILPSVIEHYSDEYGTFDEQTLRIDDHYVRTFYLRRMPNSIDPDAMKKLLSVPFHMIFTIDVAPIPPSVSQKRLNDLYLANGRTIEKQQEIRNRAGAWSSDVSYDVRRKRDELEEYLDKIDSDDQKMFYVGIYVVISAKTKSELDACCRSFLQDTGGPLKEDVLSPAWVQQIDALNTALPTGARFCEMMCPVFTKSLAGFVPFVVQELYQPGGQYFGVNRISKNIIVGDRKKLTNANGFVLGVPGGGKSMTVKLLLLEVFLNTKDDIIVIDPQNEYRALTECLGGQFIDFDARSDHHINPLDTDTFAFMDSKRTFLQDKTELMLSIFSQITDYMIDAQSKSIIGRVINKIYEGVGERKFKTPTFVDYYRTLSMEPESQAKHLALAMELFVDGALDMFAKPTNINIKNRLTVYGIAELGKEQSAVGMIIMLESIRSRIAENSAKGVATWLYIDEFHNLASKELSAQYFEKTWKEARKLGGITTAITQNIKDLLMSKTIETMLCNSEYLSLLTQSEVEIDILHKLLGISGKMLEFVKNAAPGEGILKFGDKLIPYDFRIPKDCLIYRLTNTNFFEVAELRKQMHRGKLKKELESLSSNRDGIDE